ncbi:MAG: YqaA family protein [Bryobacteraceae bacterium]
MLLKKISRFLVALGPWGILLLSAVDSAGIPVALGVDAAVMAQAARSPAMAPAAVATAVVGSTAGNFALFWIARRGGEAYAGSPAPQARTRRLREWFHRYGLVTVFIPALVPIPMPLKAFVILSGALGVAPVSFLGVVLAARILRYGGEAYLGAKLGDRSAHYLRENGLRLAAFAAILFAALYALIRLSDRGASAC